MSRAWPTRLTAALARGEIVGPLHGLPIAFKDLEAAVGFPFTTRVADLQG